MAEVALHAHGDRRAGVQRRDRHVSQVGPRERQRRRAGTGRREDAWPRPGAGLEHLGGAAGGGGRERDRHAPERRAHRSQLCRRARGERR